MKDRLYFKQLLSGQDFARDDPMAPQMANFVYLIGDEVTREAVIVDPAYRVDELVHILEEDEMQLTGVLATHFHPDHIGGNMMGLEIEGVRELLNMQGVKVHIQAEEERWVKMVTGLSDSDLTTHESGDKVTIGEIPITLMHTPGHTPGSQCFYVNDEYLVSGDTLFLEGCGRTDLPGSDPAALYESLTQRLAKIPDSTILFPGHLYSAQGHQSLGTTRRQNIVFKPKTEEQWLMMFSGK